MKGWYVVKCTVCDYQRERYRNVKKCRKCRNKENGRLRKNLSDLCPVSDLPVIESLQVEKQALMEQLAEAEADAEHLADAITWLDEKTDPCKLALELHRARKDGK